MKTTAKKIKMTTMKFLLAFTCLLVNISSQAQVFRSLIVPDKFIAYQGYEASMSVRTFSLQSDISQLRNLQASQVGANVGFVFANHVAKIRPSVGLYYSDGRTPYTIDQVEVSVASNFYFMRQLTGKKHFIEPYAVASVGYQRMKFFGTYLGDTQKNYSMGNQPELGNIDWMRVSTGVGVEAQFANDTQHFIHLFAEVQTGVATRTRSSRSEFSHTSLQNTSRFTLGIAVGLAKF